MTATQAPLLDPGPWPDQDPYERQADCPPWCSIHPQDGIPGESEQWVWLHEGKVTVGEMTVDLVCEIYPSPDTEGDYAMPPDWTQLYPHELADFAAAMTLSSGDAARRRRCPGRQHDDRAASPTGLGGSRLLRVRGARPGVPRRPAGMVRVVHVWPVVVSARAVVPAARRQPTSPPSRSLNQGTPRPPRPSPAVSSVPQ